MTVWDLNRDQLAELKQRYYIDHVDENPSYGELADIDNLVSDDEVYNEYDHVDFVPEDFFSEDNDNDFHLEVSGDGNKYDLAQDLRQIADAIENDYYSGLASYGSSWSIER